VPLPKTSRDGEPAAVRDGQPEPRYSRHRPYSSERLGCLDHARSTRIEAGRPNITVKHPGRDNVAVATARRLPARIECR